MNGECQCPESGEPEYTHVPFWGNTGHLLVRVVYLVGGFWTHIEADSFVLDAFCYALE